MTVHPGSPHRDVHTRTGYPLLISVLQKIARSANYLILGKDTRKLSVGNVQRKSINQAIST